MNPDHVIRKVTAADVARASNVSQATVSRVFNKNCKIRINEASRERVLQAAKELGYIPNAMAQTMSSGRSGIIGIVVSDYFNLFYYQVLQLLTNQLAEQNLQVMVFTTNPKKDLNEVLDRICQYQIDGVIVTSSALSHEIGTQWRQRGIPTVLFNGYPEGMEISAVQSDQSGSGRVMADYLVRVGHKRFAYVSSDNSAHKSVLARQEGFFSGLHDHGIEDCLLIPAGYSYESGLAAGEELLNSPRWPDAIFCSGDLNALGVIDAIKKDGRFVLGKDISVTGYDAPLLTRLESYSLTGMTQQTERLCHDCIQLLQRGLDHPGSPPQVITRPMLLTLRGSSRQETGS